MGDDRKDKDKDKLRKAPPKPPPSTETTEMLLSALEGDLAPTGGSGDTQQIVKKLDESLRADKPPRKKPSK